MTNQIEHRRTPTMIEVEHYNALCRLVDPWGTDAAILALVNALSAAIVATGAPKPAALKMAAQIYEDLREIIILHCNERKKDDTTNFKDYLERNLVSALRNAGASWEEIANLRWEDIDMKNRKMTLRSGKRK